MCLNYFLFSMLRDIWIKLNHVANSSMLLKTLGSFSYKYIKPIRATVIKIV